MRRWLKMLGSGAGQMDESIVPAVLRELRFPKRPRFHVGDKVVLYALGHDRVFAIVEVFTKPRMTEGPNNWDKWLCEVRSVLSMGYEDAPRLRDIDAARQLGESIRQHSHIELEDVEYERAVGALRSAGATKDSFYRP